MTGNSACLPSCLPGAVCHPTPYRGGDGGTQNMRASVPVTKTHSGTLAHSTESVAYGACRVFSVPPNFCVPPMRTTTSVRHAQRQPVSRARAGYQRQSEEAGGIVLPDIARYGGESSLPVVWARLVLAEGGAEGCGVRVVVRGGRKVGRMKSLRLHRITCAASVALLLAGEAVELSAAWSWRRAPNVGGVTGLLTDAQRYGGPGSLMVRWSHVALGRGNAVGGS